MPKCSFCGHEFPQGTGLLYVTTRGKTYWFCSKRCKKNMLEFKRKPTKFKWTVYYKKKH